MTSSVPPAELAERAAALLGRPVAAIVAARQGGNNRLYRLDTDQGPVALKLYPATQGDSRDRLGAESGALAFLGRHGVGPVPRVLATDRAANLALYQWIEGEPPARPAPAQVAAAADFAARLKDLRVADGAAALPLASEACLSAAELVTQLHHRLDRLRPAMAEAQLEDARPFLTERLEPAVAAFVARMEQGYQARGWAVDALLPAGRRTLSPSDFGFHNALADAAGRLVFLDFEYFGLDDPVKLAADFVLHPGMRLADGDKAAFLAALAATFRDDDGYADRLILLYPLYAMRWCLIMLNEFLPERWQRRALAGMRDRDGALRTQLGKAAALLSAITASDGRFIHECSRSAQ